MNDLNKIIFPLSEGVFTIGFDKKFIPFNTHSDKLEQRIAGSLLVEIQPFLLCINNEFIIIDTGLGHIMENGELQIIHNLRKINIQPTQISKVLLSHLHKDHAGGILNIDKQLTFPNATYYVYKKEFEYALQKAEASYQTESLQLLPQFLNINWLENNTIINDFITFELSGGHCPYHICYTINTPLGKLFYGGDEAPQIKQLKVRYKAKYDYNGELSMQLREKYAAQGKLENWTFLFYHDIKTPFAAL